MNFQSREGTRIELAIVISDDAAKAQGRIKDRRIGNWKFRKGQGGMEK